MQQQPTIGTSQHVVAENGPTEPTHLRLRIVIGHRLRLQRAGPVPPSLENRLDERLSVGETVIEAAARDAELIRDRTDLNRLQPTPAQRLIPSIDPLLGSRANRCRHHATVPTTAGPPATARPGDAPHFPTTDCQPRTHPLVLMSAPYHCDSTPPRPWPKCLLETGGGATACFVAS